MRYSHGRLRHLIPTEPEVLERFEALENSGWELRDLIVHQITADDASIWHGTQNRKTYIHPFHEMRVYATCILKARDRRDRTGQRDGSGQVGSGRVRAGRDGTGWDGMGRRQGGRKRKTGR